jgi:hypothetical protein
MARVLGVTFAVRFNMEPLRSSRGELDWSRRVDESVTCVQNEIFKCGGFTSTSDPETQKKTVTEILCPSAN